MKKAAIALFVLIAFASALLLAQNPPQQERMAPPNPQMRIQHRVQFLTTMLSLTPDQQQKATAIFTGEESAGEAVRQQMQSAHQSLAAAIKSNDAAGIDSAAGTIGSLTGQQIAAHAKANAAFYQILTPDQQNKYSQLERGPMHMRGPGGPGMMMRMGPRP
jgi:Spy/CpxP family protein refolding chaperone